MKLDLATTEIERRWVVPSNNETWRTIYDSLVVYELMIKQAYIQMSDGDESTEWARIRLINNNHGVLQFKSSRVGNGLVRDQSPEIAMTVDSAQAMIDRLPSIEKNRLIIRPRDGEDVEWAVDVYHGALTGLIVIEAEVPDLLHLPSECIVPNAIDVTSDFRYDNQYLAFSQEIPS